MYSDFYKIDLEKQNRIINAAYEIFSKSDYEHASTNEIVKLAGISKGLLFHYFGTKKQLYFFLYEYSYKVMLEQYHEVIPNPAADIFDRLKQTMLFKIKLSAIYPAMYQFLERFFTDTSPEVAPEAAEKYSVPENQDIYTILFNSIDYTPFKPHINPEKAFKIITYFISGYSQELLINVQKTHQPLDFNRIYEEACDYLDLLKIAFYKS